MLYSSRSTLINGFVFFQLVYVIDDYIHWMVQTVNVCGGSHPGKSGQVVNVESDYTCMTIIVCHTGELHSL